MINPIHIQQLREMIPPPVQNIVKVCNQITLLIVYCVSSRLVNFLKVSDALVQVWFSFSYCLFQFHDFTFQLFPLFLWYLLASQLLLFTLTIFLWFGSCKHCILACFIWSKNFEHALSSHGDCGFCSYGPRLSAAEILVFSLMFSQALFMLSLSFKFCGAAHLFAILTWYCFLAF